MTESKYNQKDKPNVEQKFSYTIHSDLREITEEELNKAIDDHLKHYETDGFEGKMLKLEGFALMSANLEKAFLVQASLSESWLCGANLKEANCTGANLQNTDLTGANLSAASFRNAYMQNSAFGDVQGLSEADLLYANLEGARGLYGNEFAQADVTSAKLPDDIKEFKALETVEKTSQNARKIFFAMLLGCVYSWLTIATTTDVRLLTNTASSPLPIIGTEIPIARFYIFAPLVLICLYFYFHLYLDNLWGALASLPAIFPDGKRLDERAYPWLLNTLVRKHFKRLRNRPLIARMKEWITIFLAWWVVPITMMAFWLRYIPRHEWVGTCIHIGLIVTSVTAAIILYHSSARTLRGTMPQSFQWRKAWRDRRIYQGVGVVLIGIVLTALSFGAINGVRTINETLEFEERFVSTDVQTWVPWGFAQLGYSPFLDLVEAEISARPSNWTGIGTKEELEAQIVQVKKARLAGLNLNYGNAAGAFLMKADLTGAKLQGANLTRANLQGADLSCASLQNANLAGANLQAVDFEDANLTGADLGGANLQGSNLRNADLTMARLNSTNLRRANLQWARLQGANLDSADFQGAFLHATGFQGANLHAAQLQGSNMRNAQLLGANLSEAQLLAADLTQSRLAGAVLDFADFGLTFLRAIDMSPLSEYQYKIIKDAITREVPDGEEIEAVKGRLELALKAATSYTRARAHNALCDRSLLLKDCLKKPPKLEAYVEALLTLACEDSDIAFGVARRFDPNIEADLDALSPELAKGLLSPECPGGQELPNEIKRLLRVFED